MTIGSDLDRAQVAHEFLGMRCSEVRSHPWNSRFLDKVQQVLRRRPITIDRLDRRPQDLLMMPQPSVLQLVEGHGFEAQCRRRTDFQLRMNLRGHLLRRVFVRSDTRPTATAVFRIRQIPNLAAQITSYFSNTEGTLFDSHDLAFQRIPPPQTLPQKGSSESTQETQKPMSPILGTHGPSIERRGGDSNPR